MRFTWKQSRESDPPVTREAADSVERDTRRIGLEILQAARAHAHGTLSARFWTDKLLDWAMRDPAFKVQLFRFIDVFPVLRTPEQIHEHLVQYLTQPGVTPPPGLNLGLKAGGMMKGTLASTVSSQVTAMARRFIAGKDLADALPVLRENWQQGIAFSIDLLGEACVSDAEADAYRQRYLDVIAQLPSAVAEWPDQPVLQQDHLGLIPRANVSIKISSLSAHVSMVDFNGTIDRLMASLRPILVAARDNGVFVNFDMEQHTLKDLTIALFCRCCEEVDFEAGIALQAYLRSGEHDAKQIVDWTRRTGRVVTVRLVKGAYWDYETIHAEQQGWPIPVWSRKVDTDACFERMVRIFLDATPRRIGEGGVKLAVGSHNVRSIAYALALLRDHDLPERALEIQMLRGMAEPLKGAIVERGLRLREYMPVGEMIPGMAYLVRRLLENTSNESWLRAGFREEAPDDVLLASPHGAAFEQDDHPEDPGVQRIATLGERHRLAPLLPGWRGLRGDVAQGSYFFNEPTCDFSDERQRKAFEQALARTTVPHVAVDATIAQARESVERTQAAFPAWADQPASDRANVLLKAAALMREQRDELASVILREAGKIRVEADADVCEAIDFCEYYARLAVDLFTPRRLGIFAGERNEVFHDPRGVAVVISPWNFPLAICCGMTTAALVTGNTVIVKPAEQTPAIAKLMCDILHQAGVPHDVLQFVPGRGEDVGAALVRDPRVATIAFTGSMAVGMDILQAAAQRSDTQPFVKRVIAEMGGKNAIIVDASADLDEAVLGVRNSAFGYAGQKCSAASRVIVLDDIHEAFLNRLVEATRALVVGEPLDPATDVGPVIDDEAAQKVWNYIEIGKQEGRLVLGSGEGGRLIPPHIFSEIKQEHRIANEEIFGPVLAVLRACDFDEALRIANAPGYKLTGGVFSRTPAHLEQARRQFRVGNLYLNRGITGALVGRQPFGGFGLSGIGSKAGGEDYLKQFVNPRAVTENTMRRGFAPE